MQADSEPRIAAPARPWRLAVVLAVTAAVFWRALHGEFVYDDLWLVVRNPNIQSADMLPKALTGAYWDFIDPDEAALIGYWRPLTFLTLFVGQQLGGGDPFAFHAISIALHLSATAVAFFLALRLTRNANIAFWAALLFGTHPVQVEAVAWISSVNDPLYGLLCLLGLAAFLRWRERGSPGWSLAAPICAALALLAKENAIAIVPLMLALDYGRRREPAAAGGGRLQPFWRAWLPMLVVFGAYWAARVYVFGDWRAGFDRVTSYLALSGGREMSLRIELLGGFLGLLAFPLQLNMFREVRPVIPATDAQLWTSVVWIAVWAVAGLALWRRSARPALAAFGLAVAGFLPALLRMESIGRFPLSERFLYVSVFGAGLLFAWAIGTFLPRRPAHAVLALLVLAAGIQSFRRIHVWKNEEVLFSRAALDNPNSPYVFWGYGRVLLERFRRQSDDDRGAAIEALQGAYIAFSRSQDLGGVGPDGKRDRTIFYTADDRLQANLGVGWYFFFGALSGHAECTFGEAELVFKETLRGFPRSESASTGLGLALMHQAIQLESMLRDPPANFDLARAQTEIEDKLTRAETALRRAIELNPKNVEAWFYLGRFLMKIGSACEAAEAFQTALDMQSADPALLELLGAALADCGRSAEAQRVLQRALDEQPDNVTVLTKMGVVAAQQEEFSAALRWFDRALEHDPRHGDAHLQRGKVFLRTNSIERAIPALDRACRVLPSSFEAHYNLGSILAQQGAYEDALPRLERALALQPGGPYAEALRNEIERIRELNTAGG